MLCAWWNIKSIVYYKVLNQSKTFHAEMYSNQLHKDLEKKFSSLVSCKDVLLLHDNVRPHLTQVTEEHIMALNMKVLSHPPYPLALAPSDCYLFK